MVKTFRALEYDNSRASDEERVLILNALFRPHSTKIDDSMPHAALDAILKKLDFK